MAYEEGDDYPQGQNNFGLATNPLMPMGDPLAYAKVGAAPEANSPAIHVQGLGPQRIAQPQPVSVPNYGGGHGGGGEPSTPTNQLQPDDSSGGLLGGGDDAFKNLLQLKGMQNLVESNVTKTPDIEKTAGGAPVAPGAGAGPGRSAAGAVIDKAAAPYKDMVNDAAKQNGVDPGTLTRLLYQESQFNPKALSPAGAKGIGQFMDATARDEGVNVNDPKSSIYGAAKYLAKMKNTVANGNDQLAMAAYNWGPGNVEKWLRSGADINKVPKETRDYVSAISGRPLAPNMKPNVPAANAAPMAAETAGGGGFVVPGGVQQDQGQQTLKAPGFGEAPKPGQLSPHGGPYTMQPDGKLYATDEKGRLVGKPVVSISTPTPAPTPAPAPAPSPVKATEQAGVSPVVEQFNRPPVEGPMPDKSSPAVQEFNKPKGGAAAWPPQVAPGNTGTVSFPTVGDEPKQGGTPAWMPPGVANQVPGAGNNLDMQKLWKYMLIKSLFPQIKFRNIGYDPWAVHRFGQGGGY